MRLTRGRNDFRFLFASGTTPCYLRIAPKDFLARPAWQRAFLPILQSLTQKSSPSPRCFGQEVHVSRRRPAGPVHGLVYWSKLKWQRLSGSVYPGSRPSLVHAPTDSRARPQFFAHPLQTTECRIWRSPPIGIASACESARTEMSCRVEMEARAELRTRKTEVASRDDPGEV